MVIYQATLQAWSRNESLPPITISQNDVLSRVLQINIIDRSGLPVNLSDTTVNMHFAKSDGTTVYITADILDAPNGKVQAALTSQVSAVAKPVKVTVQVIMADKSVLFVKGLTLDVQANNVDDSVESSNEFSALQNLIDQAEELQQTSGTSAVLSESWAVGGTDSRDGEDTNNSKYYAEQANTSQSAAAASATAAQQSATQSEQSATTSQQAAEQAQQSAETAQEYADSSTLSQSWAVGGTDSRPGEDIDNAKYYAGQAQMAVEGALRVIGTVISNVDSLNRIYIDDDVAKAAFEENRAHLLIDLSEALALGKQVSLVFASPESGILGGWNVFTNSDDGASKFKPDIDSVQTYVKGSVLHIVQSSAGRLRVMNSIISFNNRVGAVKPKSGDYTADMITVTANAPEGTVANHINLQSTTTEVGYGTNNKRVLRFSKIGKIVIVESDGWINMGEMGVADRAIGTTPVGYRPTMSSLTPYGTGKFLFTTGGQIIARYSGVGNFEDWFVSCTYTTS